VEYNNDRKEKQSLHNFLNLNKKILVNESENTVFPVALPLPYFLSLTLPRIAVNGSASAAVYIPNKIMKEFDDFNFSVEKCKFSCVYLSLKYL